MLHLGSLRQSKTYFTSSIKHIGRGSAVCSEVGSSDFRTTPMKHKSVEESFSGVLVQAVPAPSFGYTCGLLNLSTLSRTVRHKESPLQSEVNAYVYISSPMQCPQRGKHGVEKANTLINPKPRLFLSSNVTQSEEAWEHELRRSKLRGLEM